MTWKSFHHRGEILRAVINRADARRDGLLPMDVDGVAETFGDELTLLGALVLKWHTRLAGRIERELMTQPLDLERAVIVAWQATADELPGVRAVLDHYISAPTSDAMASALTTAVAKQHVLLALMAGRGSAADPLSEAAGRRIEADARSSYHPAVTDRSERPSLFDRLKAALAA